MNDYTKGILTGASLILCFFMFVSAKSQSGNLGDILVNSITVVMDEGKGGFITTFNGDGKKTTYLGTNETGAGVLSVDNVGTIYAYNADGKETVYLGTGQDGSGVLTTSDADGKRTAYLGTGEGGSGKLQTYNKHEVITGYFGSNKDNDGMAFLKDRYGDIGWSARGKK